VWFRFEWQFALGVVVALAHDVLVTAGIFSLFQLEFDLSIVAAFLTIIGIPFTFSIADGLALGLISHPIIKLAAGRGREVSLLGYILAAVLLAYFIFIR